MDRTMDSVAMPRGWHPEVKEGPIGPGVQLEVPTGSALLLTVLRHPDGTVTGSLFRKADGRMVGASFTIPTDGAPCIHGDAY